MNVIIIDTPATPAHPSENIGDSWTRNYSHNQGQWYLFNTSNDEKYWTDWTDTCDDSLNGWASLPIHANGKKTYKNVLTEETTETDPFASSSSFSSSSSSLPTIQEEGFVQDSGPANDKVEENKPLQIIAKIGQYSFKIYLVHYVIIYLMWRVYKEIKSDPLPTGIPSIY